MFKKLLVLFVLLTYSLAIAEPRCDAFLHSFPELKSIEFEEKMMQGKSYRLYKNVSSGALKNSPDFEHFVRNSVEVMFEPAEPFGHIRLRVGEKVYSFNYIQSTSVGAFSPRAGNGHYGFAYFVDANQIKQLESEMAQFYGHSSRYNFPPFDAYSPPLKIVKEGGDYKYISPSSEYANNSSVNADIIEQDGKYFLSQDDYKFPIKKTGDDTYEVQSYSCISSADYWTKRFGVNLDPRLSAKSLKETLLSDNHGLSKPDMIFEYAN
ncbi:hypothetical protein N9B72_02130 [Bacteriovoracaceae bacterium]|nr:hypothetical protein [Bacteriovoracaceae bacterium]